MFLHAISVFDNNAQKIFTSKAPLNALKKWK